MFFPLVSSFPLPLLSPKKSPRRKKRRPPTSQPHKLRPFSLSLWIGRFISSLSFLSGADRDVQPHPEKLHFKSSQETLEGRIFFLMLTLICCTKKLFRLVTPSFSVSSSIFHMYYMNLGGGRRERNMDSRGRRRRK